MTSILMTAHVLIGITLVFVVLIQRGQGADIGASFGSGGAQTLFGSRGSGSFLGKVTGGLAAAFMLTSLTLAFFTQQQAGSVVERSGIQAQQSLPSSNADSPKGFDPESLKIGSKTGTQGTSTSATIEIPISAADTLDGTNAADDGIPSASGQTGSVIPNNEAEPASK